MKNEKNNEPKTNPLSQERVDQRSVVGVSLYITLRV